MFNPPQAPGVSLGKTLSVQSNVTLIIVLSKPLHGPLMIVTVTMIIFKAAEVAEIINCRRRRSFHALSASEHFKYTMLLIALNTGIKKIAM